MRSPFALAEIVAVCEVLTELTVAVTVEEDAPDATVTLVGTATALLLLTSATLRPPEGATEFNDTVHVADPAPVNELPPHDNALIEGASCEAEPLRLIEVVFETVPCVAVSVTVCEALTLDTIATKLALVDPDATVTETGTLTALPLLARLTVVPPLGAGALSVTLQVSEPAPIIVELAQLTPARDAVTETAPLPCNLTVRPTDTFELVTAFTLNCPIDSVAEPGS